MMQILQGDGVLRGGAIANPDPAAPFNAHRDAILAAISAGARTFEAVRAELKLDADALPDGHVHQVALDAGYVVL